jgi:hypothetical protein
MVLRLRQTDGQSAAEMSKVGTAATGSDDGSSRGSDVCCCLSACASCCRVHPCFRVCLPVLCACCRPLLAKPPVPSGRRHRQKRQHIDVDDMNTRQSGAYRELIQLEERSVRRETLAAAEATAALTTCETDGHGAQGVLHSCKHCAEVATALQRSRWCGIGAVDALSVLAFLECGGGFQHRLARLSEARCANDLR